MTELAIHQPAAVAPYTGGSAVDRLAAWAHGAEAAHQLATALCGTQFVPAAYRGKPGEATAAILAGAEVGLAPLASLRAFDSIKGVPAPKAITLRAVVQAAGHDVEIVQATPASAIVRGRRRGAADWQVCEWTIDRAMKAGYVASNPNYKTKPAEMLVARATAELCRWIASDAIMGMPYSAEELADGGVGDVEQPEPVTAAELQQVAAAPSMPDRQALSPDARQRLMDVFAAAGLTLPGERQQAVCGALGRQVVFAELTDADVDVIVDYVAEIGERPAAAVDAWDDVAVAEIPDGGAV